MEKNGYVYYQYCPKCGGRLEAPTMHDLRELFVKHYRDDHPSVYRGDLNDEKVRRTWAGTTLFREPKETQEPPEFPTFHNPDGDNEHMRELARAELSKEPKAPHHPSYNCPLCPASFSALSCDDLEEVVRTHNLSCHSACASEFNLAEEELEKALALAEATPVSKELSDHYYFTAVCPECDTKLVEMRSGTLVEMALAHVADRHSDLSPDLRTQLCRAITDDRVLHKGGPHEPKETTATQVSMGYFKSVCDRCDHEIRGKTATDFEANVRHHVASVHFHPSAPRYKDAVQKILDAQLFVFGDDPKDAPVPKPPIAEDLREPTPKPPIGIEPEHTWQETRMFDLIACINRYNAAGFPVKDEWMIELERYLSLRTAPKYAGSKRGFGQPPFHDGDTPLSALKETL
jgi:hypothetical protein